MITATIFEAKTNLPELLKQAQRGEVVIITSGRDKTPVSKPSPRPPESDLVPLRRPVSSSLNDSLNRCRKRNCGFGMRDRGTRNRRESPAGHLHRPLGDTV